MFMTTRLLVAHICFASPRRLPRDRLLDYACLAIISKRAVRGEFDAAQGGIGNIPTARPHNGERTNDSVKIESAGLHCPADCFLQFTFLIVRCNFFTLRFVALLLFALLFVAL